MIDSLHPLFFYPMQEDVTRYLLNNMPVAQFFAYYLASLLGALVWFLIKTVNGIAKDKDTPSSFSWKYFSRGAAKFLISVLILPWAVIYFPDYGPFFLKLLFEFPAASAEDLNNVIMQMNAGSAFLMGFFVDFGIRRITHKTFKKIMP